ncbi:MAG: hypothetical protein P8J32_01225 [bacterium]|nr:hypothetical protein [bacterium]
MSKAQEQVAPFFIEKTLLEPMSKLQTHPMSDDEMKMMMSIMFAEKGDKIDEMYEELKAATWVLKAVEKRVEVSLTANIDKATQIFLVMFTEGNIGRSVIYLYYLQWWAKKNNKRDIAFDDICMTIFPMGFPSSDDIRPLWDAQKAQRGLNYIDVPEASASIQFEVE